MSVIRALRNRPFIFFTIILLLKGALAWFVVFDDGPSWATVVTEIPFFWMVFCVIEWFATKRKFLYYMIVNLLLTVLYFAVLMYYKYYGVIVTYHALNQADKVTKVGDSTYSLIDPYYLLIFLDIVIIGIFMLRPKTVAKLKNIGMRKVNRRVLLGAFSLSAVLCIFSIWPNHASMNEIKKAEGMGILNYEVYTIFADTAIDEELIDKKDITQEAIDRQKGIQPPLVPAYYGADRGKNLIVIQMESFQNFLIGLKIDGQEITPNINKLAAENFHYDNFYTSVGSGTTSDAEYVVNTSFYVPRHEPAIQNYAEKALPSLPKLLGSNGYATATFHTNEISFWNRTELYKSLGWQKYYDKKFYGNDDHVAFGASDEVLFDKTIDKLEEMDRSEQPFYAMVISMSAHHPFNLPERKYKMKLPERYEGTLVGDYIRSQNYADYALGQFVEDLKARGLWDDSVILFYGDHQGLSLYALNNKEKDLMKEVMGREYGYTDMFNVPLIMHAPGVTYPAKWEQTGGQIDILPTAANLLGVSLKDQIHFGEDLLNQTTNLLPMRHFLPTGSFINDTSMFLPGISYEDGTNYSVLDNSVDANGSTEDQYNRALKLLNMSDSYVKQLPDKDPNVGPIDGSQENESEPIATAGN